MIKRRDYRHLHHVDGDDDESSSSSGSDSDSASDSEKSGRDGESDISDGPGEVTAAGRESDSSESDAEEEDGDGDGDGSIYTEDDKISSEEDAEREDDKRRKLYINGKEKKKKISRRNVWAEAVDEAEDEKARGKAQEFNYVVDVGRKGSVLKCRVCPAVLCLSERDMEAHLKSKKHRNKAMLLGKQKLKPALDSDGEINEDSDGETHAERHARMLSLSSTQKPPVLGKKRKLNKARRRRKKLKAAVPRGEEKGRTEIAKT